LRSDWAYGIYAFLPLPCATHCGGTTSQQKKTALRVP
jgi:hypothetical protein